MKSRNVDRFRYMGASIVLATSILIICFAALAEESAEAKTVFYDYSARKMNLSSL